MCFSGTGRAVDKEEKKKQNIQLLELCGGGEGEDPLINACRKVGWKGPRRRLESTPFLLSMGKHKTNRVL
jgi:nitric oxide synthase oxygenase domain/subunit